MGVIKLFLFSSVLWPWEVTKGRFIRTKPLQSRTNCKLSIRSVNYVKRVLPLSGGCTKWMIMAYILGLLRVQRPVDVREFKFVGIICLVD